MFRTLVISTTKSLRYTARTYHHSILSKVKIVEVVPVLGESITEGSISEWVKKVGDAVKPDDVVAVIETDKVTVDIKANHTGIITQLLADGEVLVGNPLYELDTEGKASASLSKSADSSTTSANEKKSDDHANDSTDETHPGRKPRIHFIGKRSHAKEQKQPQPPKQQQQQANTTAPKPPQILKPATPTKPTKPQSGVSFTSLKGGAFYGRPQLSAKEIAAIESGGADIM